MSDQIHQPHVESVLAAAVRRDEHGTETISTLEVSPPLRNAVWEACNRTHLIGLKASSPALTGVLGTMRSALLNGVSVADISGNAHTVERTPAMTHQLRIDSVMFTFVLSGESFHYYNGGSPVLVRPGEVAVYDSDHPFLLGFSEGMRAVAVSVPRYHLADIGLQDTFRTLKVLRHTGSGVDSRSARQLLEVFLGAFEPPAGVDPHEFGERFVADVLQAVRALTGQPRDPTKDYLHEALAFIDRHLADPGLSVAHLAQELNLSKRHLSRVFAGSDSTVAQAILQQRLRHARGLLTDPGTAHLTAAEVGLRSGFTSPSHFSRVFRGHFGMSPTQARGGQR